GELFEMLVKRDERRSKRPEPRVLLLSATPYRMLTNAEDDESHFDGFERTVKFLLGDGRDEDLLAVRRSLGELRADPVGRRVRQVRGVDQAARVFQLERRPQVGRSTDLVRVPAPARSHSHRTDRNSSGPADA